MSLYRTTIACIVLSVLCFSGLAVGFSVVTPSLAIQIFGMLCLCLFGGLLTAEGLVNALSWRHWAYSAVLFVIGGLFGYLWPHFMFTASKSYSFLLLLNLVLLGLYYLCYQVNPELSVTSGRLAKPGGARFKWTYWHLCWRNRSYRTLLLVAFGFQFAFLNFFIRQAIQKSGVSTLTYQEIQTAQPIISLFLTPMMLFSYCLNNVWAFFPISSAITLLSIV